MRIASVTEIKNNSKAAGSKFAEGFKKVATSDAAKATGVVLGGSALLGVGYAVFAKTANTVYSAMS